jgi:cell division ATPase FtsA
MPREEVICGLDIGSGQVVCALGQIDQNSELINIISSGQDVSSLI